MTLDQIHDHERAVDKATEALAAAGKVKNHGTAFDQRAVALAITNIEQGLLWLKHARPTH